MGRTSLALVAGLLLCCVPGCAPLDPPEPETYPVRGKVVFAGGEGDVEKLQGWIVQFQSVAQSDTRATGEIGQDGTFEVVSIVNNRGKEGVVAGQHRVCVVNVLDPAVEEIDPKFNAYDTSGITVTVPTEQELVIEVSRKPADAPEVPDSER